MGRSEKKLVARGRNVWGAALPRATSPLTAVLAVLVTVEATCGALAEDAAVLVAGIVLGLLVAALRLWTGCSVDVRAATGGLVGLILLGQVVVSSGVGPGGRGTPWSASAACVVGLAAVVLLLLVARTSKPRGTEQERHPYAL